MMVTTFIGLIVYKFDIFWVWIVMVLCSVCYSFMWDIYGDFGFLEKHTKNFMLRNKLYYPKKCFYYLGIVFNLVLRFTWMLTISPNFINSLVMKVMVRTLLGICEIFRRTLWNMFKVELENLKFENDFYTIEGFKLPFDINIKKGDELS